MNNTRALFGTRKQEIDEQFHKFHTENPEVWNLFVEFTWQLITKGFEHYSADAVVHRIRWHSAVETTGGEYKINNNFVAGYARLFNYNYPSHRGFFRNRERVSAKELL